MMRIQNLVLLLSIALSAQAQISDTTFSLQEATVTSNRIEESMSSSAKSIQVLDQEDLARLPVRTTQEALQYIGGVQVRSRGMAHVQSDLKIRGGTFDQVLIMVDGVKLNDIQTGHHNMNIPVPLEMIERIEVVKGPGSRIYGVNAYSGVIHIITKKEPSETIGLHAYGGGFGSGGGSISSQVATDQGNHFLAVQKDFSEGYRYNTDYDINNYYYKGDFGNWVFQGGFTERAFGANGFYADPSFEDQYEEIQTSFAALQHQLAGDQWVLKSNAYWRRNQDEYLFLRNDPDFFRNFHLSNNIGLESHLQWEHQWGITALGVDLRREILRSTNLGNHERDCIALAAEHQLSFLNGRVTATPGLLFNYYSDHGGTFLPGLEAAWQASQKFTVYGSSGMTFRVPTFTDLYYTSPVEQGNPELVPERALTHELGMRYSGTTIRAQAVIFQRSDQNLISWRRVDESLWRGENIDPIVFRGLEFQLSWMPELPGSSLSLDQFQLQYTYLDGSFLTDQSVFRYAFNHLDHQLILDAGFTIGEHIYIQPAWRWAAPPENIQSPYQLLDLKLEGRIGQHRLYLEAVNLLNEEYLGANGVVMPGRWIRAGGKFNFQIR